MAVHSLFVYLESGIDALCIIFVCEANLYILMLYVITSVSQCTLYDKAL